MKRTLIPLGLLICFLAFPSISLAAPVFQGAEQVYSSDEITDDAYMAGGMVVIDSNVDGDLFVTGGSVTINGNVQGDLMVAGGNVTLKGVVSDDVRVAGGNIVISSPIVDDLFVAGGNVTIDKNASVGGSVTIGGGFVHFQGTVKENLLGGVGMIVFGGEVDGNVMLGINEEMRTLSTAKVLGNMVVESEEAPTFDTSFVQGTFEFKKIEGLDVQKKVNDWLSKGVLLAYLFSFLVSFVLGIVLLFVCRYTLRNVANVVRKKPLQSLGYGFVTFIVLLALLLLSFITIIGLKVGLLLLFTLIAFFVIIAVFNGYFIGSLLMRKKEYSIGMTIVFFGAGLLIYEILGMIPFVGWLVILVVSLMNLGGIYETQKDLYLKLKKSKQI